MKIAVVGMGRMGHAVAARLLAGGHGVVVWNRSPGKADDLLASGATEAGSVGEAAGEAELVVTSLTDDAAVLEVVRGGLAEGLAPGAVYADMSTVAPETAAEIAEVTGGRSLASPILGAPAAVESGEAAYLVSGPEACFAQAAAAYESLGERVTYAGADPRRALQLKLVANYLLLTGVVALGEAVVAAQAAGVPGDQLKEFLGSSPLVAPGLRNRLDGIVGADHAGWFTTPLGAKDVGLAQQMASREGVRLPLADLVKRRYEEAAAAGYADDDLTAVVELLRQQRTG